MTQYVARQGDVLTSAHAAAAWTFQMDESDYRPLVES